MYAPKSKQSFYFVKRNEHGNSPLQSDLHIHWSTADDNLTMRLMLLSFRGCLTSHQQKCDSGTDLLRQFHVLPHRDRSCRSNFLSHLVTVYWHCANPFWHWSHYGRHVAGQPLQLKWLSSLLLRQVIPQVHSYHVKSVDLATLTNGRMNTHRYIDP